MEMIGSSLGAMPRARTAQIAMIGSVTAAFAVFGVMLSFWLMTAFRPFGGTDVQNVVLLTQTDGVREVDAISASNVVLLRERSKSIAATARVQFTTLYLRTASGLEPAYIALVSPEFLDLFEAEFVSGRPLQKSDEPWTNGPVGLITESYWRNHLGSDPNVLGRQFRTGDWSVPSLPVVGVLSKRFRGFGYFTNRPVDLILPLPVQRKEREGRNHLLCTALALLTPGATADSARREINDISFALRRERLMNSNTRILLRPASLLFRTVRQRLTLATLTTAIAFLLVLVCSAGVKQVRAIDRVAEISIRQALGATQRQIVWLLLNENLRSFAFAAICGASIAAIAIQWLGPAIADGIGMPPAMAPTSVRWLPFGMLVLVPIFAAVVTMAQFLMLLPALGPTSLATRSRWTPGRVALRRGLVAAQGAAATGLAFAAIAACHGLVSIEKRDLGFDPVDILSARVTLTQLANDRSSRWDQFYSSLRDELKRVPGVRAVGIVRSEPGESSVPSLWTTVEPLPAQVPVLARHQLVHPSYFLEMKVPAIAGRLCDAVSPGSATNPAVINEAMAQRYWPNANPIGTHLNPGHDGPLTIVGVVPSMRRSLMEAAPAPEVFDCAAYPQMYVMIRHSGDWQNLSRTLLPMVHKLEPNAAVDDIVPIDELLDRSLRPTKVMAGFLASLGAVSVIVAALGLFAISAMMVSQRRTELAIRIAVGADPIATGPAGRGRGTLARIDRHCRRIRSVPDTLAIFRGARQRTPVAMVRRGRRGDRVTSVDVACREGARS